MCLSFTFRLHVLEPNLLFPPSRRAQLYCTYPAKQLLLFYHTRFCLEKRRRAEQGKKSARTNEEAEDVTRAAGR